MLSSCRSALKKEIPETIDIIDFPTFPAPVDREGNTFLVFDEEKQNVTMPFWYWKQIVFYVAETEEAVAVLKCGG